MSNNIHTVKREQSPRWLSLLRKVLLSAEDDLANNPDTNDETYKRALSWLEVLLSGKPLSPKQAANFLESIRKRVRGKSGFVWADTIALTKKQIADEKVGQTMDRFNRASRTKSTVVQCLMDAIKAKLDDLDWTDADIMGAFQAHIVAFDPAVSETVEEEQPAIAPSEPVEANPLLDDIIKRFPVRERFPSNTWSEEHMGEVHGAYSFSKNTH